MFVNSIITAVLALAFGLAAGFLLGRRYPLRRVLTGHLHRILDTAPIGVIINTRAGRNLYRNTRALAFFKAQDQTFATGGVISLYANPDDRERYVERLYRDGTIDGETVLLRKGNGEIYTGSMASFVIGRGKDPYHISWIRDLTRQLAADAEMRDLAERLELALEVTNSAVWDADIPAGTCWWSDSFWRMLGYREKPDMPADFWESRLHPDDRPMVMTSVEDCLNGRCSTYDIVYRLCREDGSWLWIEDKGRVIRDGEGDVVRYVGIMTDIADRRRRDEELRASRERLLAILEAAPISVNITRRADGRWLFCNAHSATIFGRRPDELLADSAAEWYVNPEDRNRLIRRLEAAGSFRDAEVAFRRPDGTVVWVLSSWSEIDFDGERALLTWLYDITDRKLAEAAMRAARDEAERALTDLRIAQNSLIQAETMASLGQLVAGVAHEINTPVGIGLTAATHIAEETDRIQGLFAGNTLRKTDLAAYLGRVNEGTRLLVANINRAAELVQSFKQVAVDQSSGDRRPFDLGSYINEILFSLRPRLKRTQVAVSVECPEGIAMDSYPGALSQVLSNLTINAVIHGFGEAGPEGGRQGTITIRAARIGGEQVEILFEDTGKGIPADVLPRIFDPFFTTKRGEGGSGLGLHIVFNTMTQVLGGRIAVESHEGEGTRFRLTLPRSAPLAAALPPGGSPMAVETGAG
ncbi:PAS domain S-box-containing protein [Azospirillum fermentarium]|uniref:PAS domain-containing protein n=1 Tax=Azospirillum fermentarium TaxID=1233114 RepID=UPI002225C75A|nr:PAS domain-containing protein [Azospirillum fermentarium]MCW2247030.1 PAS domain S-box-containing protein [Azospirillum fermentarium]